MSNYPTSKELLKTDTNPDDVMTGHAELHNEVNDVVNDLQEFVGYHENIEGTTVVDSLKTLNAEIGDNVDSIGIIIGEIVEINEEVEEIQQHLTNIDNEIPPQKDNGGKFLYTDGKSASWEEIETKDVDTSGFLPKGDELVAEDAVTLEKLIEENRHNIASVEKAVKPFVDENLTWQYLAEKSKASNA